MRLSEIPAGTLHTAWVSDTQVVASQAVSCIRAFPLCPYKPVCDPSIVKEPVDAAALATLPDTVADTVISWFTIVKGSYPFVTPCKLVPGLVIGTTEIEPIVLPP